MKPRSLAQGQRRVGHFVHRVAPHQPVAVDAMHRPAARIQQAQVVVDLRRRGNRRPRIARRVLLLDGDGGRQPIDLIYVRLLNAF